MILQVELADNDATRAQGLRGRTALHPGTGMLFVWNHSVPRAMTMRETSIPLDIAFVDSHGRITSIARSIPAYTIPLIGGVGQYVIEAPAGTFARIRPGSRVIGPRST